MAKEFLRYFDRGIIESQSDVVPVKTAYFDGTAATNNQQVAAGVTGKKIRVLFMSLTSNGAQSSVLFKSASGGTNLFTFTIPANTVAEPNVILQSEFGVIETISGEGLYVDVGAVRVLGTVRYIEATA